MYWLKLKSDGGVDIHFRLRGYKIPDKNNHDEWCIVDLILKSNNINYSLTDDESLEVTEVYWLETALENALIGLGDDLMRLSPTEPYMIFEIYPRYKLGKDTFPLMNWKIILWDNGIPSESTINLVLYETEMRLLLNYLKYAKGLLSIQDSEIKNMINNGFLV